MTSRERAAGVAAVAVAVAGVRMGRARLVRFRLNLAELAIRPPEFEIEVETGPTIYEETVAHGGSQAAFSETPMPSHSSLAREDTPSARAVSVSTPIVLPGESLSRYGAKPAEFTPRAEARAASAPVASGIAYKPSTLVEVVPTWDGGAELPGESLSRHRGKPASAPAAAQPVEPTSVIEAQFVTAEPEAMVEHEAQAAGIEETAQHALAGEISAEPAVAEEFSTPEHHAEPVTHHEAIAEPAAEIEEHAHEEAIFEPEHASASYRVDPAAPSEYRLSAVIEEEEEAAIPAPVAEIEHPLAGHSVDEAETATPHAVIDRATAVEEIPVAAHEEATQHHALIDRHAEVVESSQPETAHAGHTAVEELPEVSETEFLEESEEDELAIGAGGFAPGAGTIEEEIIEEEEYDFEPIRAHGDEHDLYDLEEETLDSLAGAELGEMVRDTHLNQRIGAAPDGVTEEDEAEPEYGEIESDLDEEEDEQEAGEEQAAASSPAPARRDGRPDDGRRGGRGPRRRGRPNGGGGGSRRANSQLSDLPIISELLKQGQEILVQIAKEPIAKKGARITSHIALPGRFLVFMPTVNHVGVSRKISSDEERQRLKRILISEKGAASGGFIVRTAADGASEDDLRADIALPHQPVERHQAARRRQQSSGADLSRPQPDRARAARPGLGELLDHLGR